MKRINAVQTTSSPVIYVKTPNRISFFQGRGSMRSLGIGQMFDIYLSSHIYCELDTPSGSVRFVITPCSEIEQIVCASVWRVIIFGGCRLRYNGVENVIHFAITLGWMFTWGLRPSTRCSDINIPTLTPRADLVIYRGWWVTWRVAEKSSVSLWLRSCVSVCGAGISVRPWLSWNHGSPCRTSTPSSNPCYRSSCHQLVLPVDSVAAHTYSWSLKYTHML